MNFQGFLHCTLGLTIATVSLKTAPAIAQMTQQELDANGVVTIASPYQNGERHQLDRKSTRLNSSHVSQSRMPSSA